MLHLFFLFLYVYLFWINFSKISTKVSPLMKTIDSIDSCWLDVLKSMVIILIQKILHRCPIFVTNKYEFNFRSISVYLWWNCMLGNLLNKMKVKFYKNSLSFQIYFIICKCHLFSKMVAKITLNSLFLVRLVSKWSLWNFLIRVFSYYIKDQNITTLTPDFKIDLRHSLWF